MEFRGFYDALEKRSWCKSLRDVCPKRVTVSWSDHLAFHEAGELLRHETASQGEMLFQGQCGPRTPSKAGWG